MCSTQACTLAPARKNDEINSQNGQFLTYTASNAGASTQYAPVILNNAYGGYSTATNGLRANFGAFGMATVTTYFPGRVVFGTGNRVRNPSGPTVLCHWTRTFLPRMVTTMANELHQSGKQTALIGICAAGGLGAAAVLERV